MKFVPTRGIENLSGRKDRTDPGKREEGKERTRERGGSKELDRFHLRSIIPLFLFVYSAAGEDAPSNTKKAEVPEWRRSHEENENPAVVLAREFSISDSANPFYLKLRNSILPA